MMNLESRWRKMSLEEKISLVRTCRENRESFFQRKAPKVKEGSSSRKVSLLEALRELDNLLGEEEE